MKHPNGMESSIRFFLALMINVKNSATSKINCVRQVPSYYTKERAAAAASAVVEAVALIKMLPLCRRPVLMPHC